LVDFTPPICYDVTGSQDSLAAAREFSVAVSKVEDHVLEAAFTSDTPIEVIPIGNLPVGGYRIQDAVKFARALHEVAPLDSVIWNRISGNTYDMQVSAKDGRQWRQTTDITVTENPGVKFDVRDHYWFFPEFGHIQRLRLALTYLSGAHGLSGMEINFE
jgi:hypothetical protein